MCRLRFRFAGFDIRHGRAIDDDIGSELIHQRVACGGNIELPQHILGKRNLERAIVLNQGHAVVR